MVERQGFTRLEPMGLSAHIVSCPPGMLVFGGGGLVEGPEGNWLMTSSLAISDTAWYVAWLNIDQQTAATATGLAEVAICGSVISGTVTSGRVLQPEAAITAANPISTPEPSATPLQVTPSPTPAAAAPAGTTGTPAAPVSTVEVPPATAPAQSSVPMSLTMTVAAYAGTANTLMATDMAITGTPEAPVSTAEVPFGTPPAPASTPMSMTMTVTAYAGTANALMGTDMAITGTPAAPGNATPTPTPTPFATPGQTPTPTATGGASLSQWLAAVRCAVGLCK